MLNFQKAYDDLCHREGASPQPYFLIRYTKDTFYMSPLGHFSQLLKEKEKVNRKGFLSSLPKFRYFLSILQLASPFCFHSVILPVTLSSRLSMMTLLYQDNRNKIGIQTHTPLIAHNIDLCGSVVLLKQCN